MAASKVAELWRSYGHDVALGLEVATFIGESSRLMSRG